MHVPAVRPERLELFAEFERARELCYLVIRRIAQCEPQQLSAVNALAGSFPIVYSLGLLRVVTVMGSPPALPEWSTALLTSSEVTMRTSSYSPGSKTAWYSARRLRASAGALMDSE